MKIATAYSSRLSQAAIALGVWAVLIGTAAAAKSDSSDPAFEPGYRFVQTSAENGPELNSRSIDLSWAAISRYGFQLDLGTGLRVMKRFADNQKYGSWTAYMGITAPWPVAPYVELGFDAGEVLGEVIIDRAVKNTTGRNWIDPDAYVGAGLRVSLTRRIQLKAYYKFHYIESEQFQALDSGAVGLAVVLRFPRKHLEWWQIPL